MPNPTVSLVTGGAGFIGAHVVKELLALGHRVVVLDDLSGGFQDQVDPRAVFIQGSITDDALVERLFAEHKFTYVYHLAAYAAEGLSHFIRRFNYTNNLLGSINLINASVRHEVKCFVFTSSIAVYGALKPPMREDMRPVPEDPYGVAKYAVEMDLYAAKHMFGLDYVVFRPHNVYGEYQNLGDRYRNVVGIFMNQLMQGKPLTIFGDGTQQRAFTYVGDIAPVIARSATTPAAFGEIFNIGADKPYTVNELAGLVMEAMGLKGEVKHLEARNEVAFAFSDHSKVARVFGKQTETGLGEGLRRMSPWAKATGARLSAAFGNIEIERNLPPSWLHP
ncbi:MAG: NAD-dependent epimerase/dehydratase family protein [Bacteroidetes bacterium]|nr:NAD-dependent epimerase/dehydratase family protein [Bacteroidota bacterium]MBS1942500.1 NAD-dependent epimerase/dehydratase family protein [Bacteroidota bacterium]